MSVLSENLRSLRGSTSQAEMAKGIGIPQQAWARYERGVVAPNAETLVKICQVHSCSSDWLLGLDRKSSTVVVGSNNAVGPGASVNVTTAKGSAPVCKQCPYKYAVRRLQKAGMKLDGLS